MPDSLKLIPEKTINHLSDFDWINIERDRQRIGKIRVHRKDNTLTIFSINIFPEFERRGYARKILDIFKASFVRIIADRVRYTAVEFWLKMGFTRVGPDRYIYVGDSRYLYCFSDGRPEPRPRA